MKKFVFLACLFLVPATTFAQTGKQITDKEYQELLKKSPFNKMYPKVTAEASAKFFGEWNKLFAGSPLPTKSARLAAVSASAAIRCEYCITAQVILAKQAGASDDEIKAAIQIAAEVSRFSVLLYGNEFGQENLKKILEKMTQKSAK